MHQHALHGGCEALGLELMTLKLQVRDYDRCATAATKNILYVGFSATEDPPCREVVASKICRCSKSFYYGMEAWRGVVSPQVLSLDHGSKFRGPLPIALVLLCIANTHNHGRGNRVVVSSPV
ncbi:hypothetical protein TNCV_2865511 [Trichonephila clavipes]|nr:hypothetical protein TNCV_2865511 [Trichonephila clavipes]